MIEKIENIVISKLIYYHLVKQEEIEIYKFGLECYILKILHYTTYCLVALICGRLYEFLIFIVSYIMLRKYAGGFHANTRAGCLLISNVALLGILIIGERIQNSVFLFLISILSVVVIILFAPVDNPNRILSSQEREKFKRCTIFICLFELTLAFIGYRLVYLKWIHFGIITGALMIICGKIKYSIFPRRGTSQGI